MLNKTINRTPCDFICDLEDYITLLISETDIDITALKSFYAYKGYEDRIEIDYDADEAYPRQLSKFCDLLNQRGWYYTLCRDKTSKEKWRKATKNKKLYNRIRNLVNDVIKTSF